VLLITLGTLLLLTLGFLCLPGSIEGTYRSFDDLDTITGTTTYLRFENGKAASFNVSYPEPARVFGEYDKIGSGIYKITLSGDRTETGAAKSYLVRCRLLSLHFPQGAPGDSPWSLRMWKHSAIAKKLRSINFVKTNRRSDGSSSHEFYDNDLNPTFNASTSSLNEASAADLSQK